MTALAAKAGTVGTLRAARRAKALHLLPLPSAPCRHAEGGDYHGRSDRGLIAIKPSDPAYAGFPAGDAEASAREHAPARRQEPTPSF